MQDYVERNNVISAETMFPTKLSLNDQSHVVHASTCSLDYSGATQFADKNADKNANTKQAITGAPDLRLR